MIKLINVGQLVSYNSKTGKVETLSNVQILVDEGRIVDISSTVGLAGETIDCQGNLVTPGFVDPHTHPVFFKGREEEYNMRLGGMTYEEIAQQGGGIKSSIDGVRTASENELIEKVSKRMERFLRMGTTTVEAKSGYGLDTESELKSLRVLEMVNRIRPIDIVPTFLGAHAFPPEFEDDPDGYVDLICNEMIPAVADQGIAQFCDVFCEDGYFSIEQSRRILEKAKIKGMTPRVHADEFLYSGAAELAVEVHAISADHLMAVNDAGINALAGSRVTAVLLPGTTFFLGKSTFAPARKLIDMGIPVALATDYNPGSSHIQSMPFILSLACMNMGMTVEEAFTSSTYNAAVALGVDHEVGSLEIGKKADLVIWDLEQLLEIPYFLADTPVRYVLKDGRLVYNNQL